MLIFGNVVVLSLVVKPHARETKPEQSTPSAQVSQQSPLVVQSLSPADFPFSNELVKEDSDEKPPQQYGIPTLLAPTLTQLGVTTFPPADEQLVPPVILLELVVNV